MSDTTSIASSIARHDSVSIDGYDSDSEAEEDFRREAIGRMTRTGQVAQQTLAPPRGPSGVAGVRVQLGSENPVPNSAQAQIDHSDFKLRLRAVGGAEKTVEMNEKVVSTASAIFERTKALIIQHLQPTIAAKGFTAQQIKVQINYTTQVASWAGPDGKIETLDLTDRTIVQKDVIKAQMQEFLTAVSVHRPLSQYEEMIAGPVSGKNIFGAGVAGMGATLERFAKRDLQKLMKKSLGREPAAIEVCTAMKDMATVDLYKRNLTEELKKLLTAQGTKIAAEKAQANGGNPQTLADLEHDLKILKKNLAALEGAHNEALYAFIAIEGLGQTNRTPVQQADRVEQTLRDYLVKEQKIDHKWGGTRKKERGLDRGHDLFIKGVGALALPAEGADHRVVFNKYAESKRIHAEYGTGIEGSFLFMKVIEHHAGFPRVGPNEVNRRNELIRGGIKDAAILRDLGNAMAKARHDVTTVHGQIDALTRRVGVDAKTVIKEGSALIKAA